MASSSEEYDSEAIDECPLNGSVSDRVGCILSYAGSETDVWINYTVLAINTMFCCWVVSQQQRSAKIGCHVASLVFVVAFQIGLCLQLGCAGISIVWCAMMSWAWREQQQQTTSTSSHWVWSWIPKGLTATAIIYYGIVSPVITTAAHFCALALGYFLSYLESLSPCFGSGEALYDNVSRPAVEPDQSRERILDNDH